MMSAATTMPDLVHALSKEAFREGMSRLGAACNIITTDGPAGRAGFTASAVCSVTDSPPTLLVCVNRSSSVYDRFADNEALCVNTLKPDHEELSRLFGGKIGMDERFAAAAWTTGHFGRRQSWKAPTFHLIAGSRAGRMWVAIQSSSVRCLRSNATRLLPA